MLDKAVRFLSRRRSFLLALTGLIIVIVAHPTPSSLGFGLILIVIGQAIRFWSAGRIEKTSALATSGPYAIMRNPLYAGSLFIACGYCVMTGGWLVWAIVIPVFFAVHSSAITLEERFLLETFGSEYTDYCKTTPRWIPRLSAPPNLRRGYTSWRQIRKNTEHIGGLATMAVILALAVKTYFRL